MKTFYLQHGDGAGPFLTEAVEAREHWTRQPRRGSVTACRFLVRYGGRWRRLYSDAAASPPHFIRANGGRVAVTGVCP